MKKSDRNEISDISESTAERIISLTPSLTEILFALKLGHRVAGVTDACDYPAQVRDWPNVACWFDPDLEKLLSLEPDLVLGLQTAHSLLKPKLESEGVRVQLVNPITVEEAITDIARIGDLLGASSRSQNLTADLRSRLSALNMRVSQIPEQSKPTAVRILDLEDGRLHVAGPLSFQYDIITQAGGQNVTCHYQLAYPKITITRLREWNPEVIFSCGFDLNTIPAIVNHQHWRSLKAVQSNRVYVFDCALTCRTGPRIVDMVELLFDTFFGK